METIKLDLIPGKKMPSLNASQYDKGRDYHIDLTENRAPYTLDGTETISLTVRKCDNTLVTMDIANTFADKSYIEFRTTEQMNACVGFNYGEITIEKNGTQISSLNFYLQVEGAPDEGGITSQSEINNLKRQITDEVDRILPDMVDEVAEPIINEKVPEKVEELVPSAVSEVATPIVEQIAPQIVAEQVPIVIGDNYYNKTETDNLIENVQTDLDNVFVEVPIVNVADISQDNESIVSGTPTITYKANNSIDVTLSTGNTNTFGYQFDTDIGLTYKVKFDVISEGTNLFECRVVKNNAYSATQYLYLLQDIVTGSYEFEFTAITTTTTLWFTVNRHNPPFSINNISIVDSTSTGWKYGNLDETLTAQDFPPTAKAVSDALPPFKLGETNFFVGQNAGINTTESHDTSTSETYDKGRYNVACGCNAFMMNTEGHHCTAIGFNALRKNTTGAINTAVGEDTLYENLTGECNVAVGTHAQQKTTDSSYNVTIGAEASRNPTNFNYSVVVGYHANYNNFSGDENVFIGADSGMSTNANNSIAIGTGVKVSGSNQIQIGTSRQDTVIIAGKKIKFNNDGTVTWETLT